MANAKGLVFSTISDARVVNRCNHKLIAIVFIAFCTLLSNGEDFEDMVEFGKQREGWLRQVLELRGGSPSHDTFNGEWGVGTLFAGRWWGIAGKCAGAMHP